MFSRIKNCFKTVTEDRSTQKQQFYNGKASLLPYDFIAKICSYLGFFNLAISAAQNIHPIKAREYRLSDISARLAKRDDVQKAIEVAKMIFPPTYLSSVDLDLSNSIALGQVIVPSLCRHSKDFDKALKLAHRISNKEEKETAFKIVADLITEFSGNLDKAFEIIQTNISDEETRNDAYRHVAVTLVKRGGKIEQASDIVATKISDEETRNHAYSDIAIALVEGGGSATTALQITEKISHEDLIISYSKHVLKCYTIQEILVAQALRGDVCGAVKNLYKIYNPLKIIRDSGLRMLSHSVEEVIEEMAGAMTNLDKLYAERKINYLKSIAIALTKRGTTNAKDLLLVLKHINSDEYLGE